MTRDQRTRRGRRDHPDRMFVARRAFFSLIVLSILLAASVAAVLAGVDRHPGQARPGNGNCAATSTAVTAAATPSCAPSRGTDLPARTRH